MRGPWFLAVMTVCVLFCFGLAGCSTIQSETDEDVAGQLTTTCLMRCARNLIHEGSPLLLRVRTLRRHGSTRPTRPMSTSSMSGWCVGARGPGFVSTCIGI